MTSTKMQNAIFVAEIGKPVTSGTRDIPIPDDGEVLVKVTATQLLPHDTYSRDKGLFFAEHLPYVLGSNIAGTVQSQTSKYKIGQHIYGPGNPLAPVPNYAGLQEYALLNVANSASVPEGLTDDEASTLPINAVTVFAGVFHPTHLAFPPPWSSEAKSFDYSKEYIVVIGAGSNCGRLAVQFAKSVGVGSIVGIASISGEKELKEFGATHVVDRHLSLDEIAKQVRGILGEDGVTRIIDCVSWTHELAIALIPQEKKSQVAILHQPRTVAELLEKSGKSKAVFNFVAGSINNWDQKDTDGFWTWLGKVVSEGAVKLPKYKVIDGLDVDKVNEALDSYQDGSAVLQAVVHPGQKA